MIRFIIRLAAIALAMGSAARLTAQDTFSIVAVDPATGEVGSAGASCVQFDAAIISDLHPGVGAINTQAAYIGANQNYARSLMATGTPPSAIIDSLRTHDAFDQSGVRQYGVAALAGGGTSAGFTGTQCMDYKGHRLGQTYAIQGNILLGAVILDSMEARFLRAEGTLADRLMEALQGANVSGADTRCAEFGTSSLSAFIRVARPGDAPESPTLDLRVVNIGRTVEPLDSLQTLYDQWKSTTGVEHGERLLSKVDIVPNPAQGIASVRMTLLRSARVQIEIFDALGRRAVSIVNEARKSGEHIVPIVIDGMPRGVYYCRVTVGEQAATRRLAIDGEKR